MKPLVSIIVPIYNKENYIEKCINTIILQTYQNIEIILVNDGSTDNSLSICKRIIKNDDRILLIDKKNAGVSEARNDGLMKASGEYIVFIDADDYIETDYIEKLIDKDYDFIICGYTVINTINDTKKIQSSNNITINDSKKILKQCLDPLNVNLMVVPYAKIFRNSIIKENNIKFRPDVSFGEDSCFVFDYLKKVKNVKFISYCGYNNLVLDGTLSRKYVINFKEQIERFSEKILEFKDYCDIEYIDYWIFRNYKLLLFNEKKANKKEFYKVLNYIKQKVNEFENISLFSKKDKLLYYLIKYKLFYIVYIIYKIR